MIIRIFFIICRFNEINYFQSTIVREYIGKYTDPHSEYFGALANYGILGLIVFLLLPIYFIKNFYKNFQYFINEKRNFDYFLIIFIFLIEGIVLDFLHNQMLWIIFAMFNYIIFSLILNSPNLEFMYLKLRGKFHSAHY